MSKVNRTKIFYDKNPKTGQLEDEHITTDYKWNQQNKDRLIMWETFIRHVKHESKLPMTNMELCDKIGFTPLILPNLKINKPYIKDNDYILFLANLLKKNQPSVLAKTLNRLTYSNDERNNIVATFSGSYRSKHFSFLTSYFSAYCCTAVLMSSNNFCLTALGLGVVIIYLSLKHK